MSVDDAIYLSDVLLLCAECRQPIKATITTERWVKVGWISPDGSCRECWKEKREQGGNPASRNPTFDN